MDSFAVLDQVRQSDGPKHTSVIRGDMQKVMQSDAAVFRTQSVRFDHFFRLAYHGGEIVSEEEETELTRSFRNPFSLHVLSIYVTVARRRCRQNGKGSRDLERSRYQGSKHDLELGLGRSTRATQSTHMRTTNDSIC